MFVNVAYKHYYGILQFMHVYAEILIEHHEIHEPVTHLFVEQEMVML